MIGSIFVATSGMRGFEQGLRVISDNTANISTPGYKSSSQQFANMMSDHSSGSSSAGLGLRTAATTLNFSQGELQSTGNDLDLAIEGDGFFTLKTNDGKLRYSRSGQFKINEQSQLVSSNSGETVLGYDQSGNINPINISKFQSSGAQATKNITFKGHLSNQASTYTINDVLVMDGAGNKYNFSVRLDAISGNPNSWTVTALNGTTVIGTGIIAFVNGQVSSTQSKVNLSFTPPNQPQFSFALDFSNNVTSTNSSTTSTLAFNTQDGYGMGQLSKVSFDTMGVLSLSYTNGNVIKGSRLALSKFKSPDGILSIGNNEYEATNPSLWELGSAETLGFGSIRSGMIEMSNVDLSEQFSELVIMQRGYQACSQVVSTANDMLTELFAMRK